MNQRVVYTVSLLILAGVVIYFTTSRPTEAPTPTVSASADVDAVVETPAPVEDIESIQTSVQKTTESLQQKIKNYKTDKGQEYREQLERNPHQTPPVALVSALKLGDIFDGVKTESEAVEAFDLYSKCVSQESVVALQTTCLRYAKRLAQTYDTLSKKWPALEASASPEAKDILKFGKN